MAACLVTLLSASATFYSFGIFFKPLQDEFGWSRALTSSAYTVFLLVYAASLYMMGRLVDKHGPRPVLAGGALLLGAGFALCSQVHALWHLYIFLALAAIGQGSTWSLATATVQRWFIKRRGLVLGIVTAGFGLGMLIFMPVLSHSISVYGWRLTYVFLGAGCWIVLTIASTFMVIAPEKKGLRPYGWYEAEEPAASTQPGSGASQTHTDQQWATGEAIRTKAFIILVIVYIGTIVPINMIAGHFVRYAIDVGIDQTVAAGAFGLIGGASIAGRIVMGGMTERISWQTALAICCFGATITILWLLVAENVWMLYVFAVIYGFFYGGKVPLLPGLAGNMFGTKSLAEIIGLATAISLAFGSIGPIIAGYIFDKIGSYSISFIFAAVIFGCAGVLAMRIRSPESSRPS